MRIIPASELYEKSDFIVIARPLTKTTDVAETTYFPDVVSVDGSGAQQKMHAVGVETRFEVLKVLKGDSHLATFVLHHFRQVEDPSVISVGGAATVSFDPSDPNQRKDFLLYLVKEKDGRYAPYGGQTDPADRSIFALDYPRR